MIVFSLAEGVGGKRNVAGGFGLKTRGRNKSRMKSRIMRIIIHNRGDGGGGGGGKINRERRKVKDSGGAKS